MPAFKKSRVGFVETDWSLIDGVRSGDQRAIDLLVERSWAPVYSHLRWRGLPHGPAEELAQGFFADVVLGRCLFARADQSKGRLRTLILIALKRYVIDKTKGEHATLIGSSTPTPPTCDPFDREWACQIIQSATRECEAHFRDRGKCAHWQAFERRVLLPARSGNKAPSLAQVAQELGFRASPDAASAVQQVKKRLNTLIRQAVAADLDDPTEVEQELVEFKQLLPQ